MTSTTSTTSTASTSNPVQDAVPAGVRDLSAGWWWFLSLGVLWTLFGAYVLSHRVGSLAAVAALVGVAFLFGGITQLAVATRVQSWRWLFIVAGILGVAAGILTLVWPAITLYVVSILVAWYLIIFGIMHLVGALVGPKLAYWWTQLPLGVAELVLGGVGGPLLGAVAGHLGDPGRGVGHRPWGGRDLRRLLGPPDQPAGRASGRLTAGRPGIGTDRSVRPGDVRAGLLQDPRAGQHGCVRGPATGQTPTP
jgi:uncharacterized membrane protein HdeD (DUF308 family)